MTDQHSYADRCEQDDVLPAFLPWPTQRRDAQRRHMSAQDTLYAEPDHGPELRAREGFAARRGLADRNAFTNEVKRRREARESQEPRDAR
jgi:hypothetical protein